MGCCQSNDGSVYYPDEETRKSQSKILQEEQRNSYDSRESQDRFETLIMPPPETTGPRTVPANSIFLYSHQHSATVDNPLCAAIAQLHSGEEAQRDEIPGENLETINGKDLRRAADEPSIEVKDSPQHLEVSERIEENDSRGQDANNMSSKPHDKHSSDKNSEVTHNGDLVPISQGGEPEPVETPVASTTNDKQESGGFAQFDRQTLVATKEKRFSTFMTLTPVNAAAKRTKKTAKLPAESGTKNTPSNFGILPPEPRAASANSRSIDRPEEGIVNSNVETDSNTVRRPSSSFNSDKSTEVSDPKTSSTDSQSTDTLRKTSRKSNPDIQISSTNVDTKSRIVQQPSVKLSKVLTKFERRRSLSSNKPSSLRNNRSRMVRRPSATLAMLKKGK